MNKSKLDNVFDIYSLGWEKMDKIFKSNDEHNPYIDPKLYRNADLTKEEKEKLISLLEGSENAIFTSVHELLSPRLTQQAEPKQTLEEACKKLYFKIEDSIPFNDTCDLRTMYFAIPTGITRPKISQMEFRWLYKNGYFPHLNWNNGKPRFHTNMWFILDFVLRNSREEIGLGIFKNLADWKPNWILLRNCLTLTIYMYNSWNLGSRILDLSDKKARKTGLTGKEFWNYERGLREDLWKTEGKIIAKEIIKRSGLVKDVFNLARYIRDEFALLSFEAFPSNFIVDMYSNPTQRGAAMFSYGDITRLAVYNRSYGNVNTYNDLELSQRYGLLFAAADWALAMSEGVFNRSASDIVNTYRRNKNNQIPCRICGAMFIPKRKIDITCGKKECINKNKNFSKRKNRISISPLG